MRIAVSLECPHCGKPIVAQSTLPAQDDKSIAHELAAKTADALDEKMASIESLVEAASAYTGVSVADILAKNRRPHISRARCFAYYLCREEGYSWASIGRALDRDPSTVRWGARVISDEIARIAARRSAASPSPNALGRRLAASSCPSSPST